MPRLEIVCGSMFSGKTTELIRKLEREQIAGRSVVAFKPNIDTRYESDAITAHNGTKIPCYLVDSFQAIAELSDKFDVVGIDEAMMFPSTDPKTIEQIVDNHHLTVAAGLDMTYRREPFGMMPYLMAIADDVKKFQAVCHRCGNDAKYTQRLVDGKPAPFEGPTIQVGALEAYEARCANCFEAA